jgi:hypothetical protein
MSGLPGISFRWSRNRKPALWIARRTRNSHEVFLLLTAAIMRLRTSGATVSVMTCPPLQELYPIVGIPQVPQDLVRVSYIWFSDLK